MKLVSPSTIISGTGGYEVEIAFWRWIVDAHRQGRCYVVHSNELLGTFLELEATLL